MIYMANGVVDVLSAHESDESSSAQDMQSGYLGDITSSQDQYSGPKKFRALYKKVSKK